MARKKAEKSIENEKGVKASSEVPAVPTVHPKVAEETYCYPEHGVAIKATSKEEADKKLKEVLDKNK